VNRILAYAIWVSFAGIMYLILTEAAGSWVRLPRVGNIGITPRAIPSLQVVALFAMVMPGLLALIQVWMGEKRDGAGRLHAHTYLF